MLLACLSATACTRSVAPGDGGDGGDAPAPVTAEALVGEYVGFLQITFETIDDPDAGFTPGSGGVTVTIRAAGGELLLREASPLDGQTARVGPDGGLTQPCEWPLVIEAGRARFAPGAMCVFSNFVTGSETRLQGELTPRDGGLAYWGESDSVTHLRPGHDVHIRTRFDFTSY